MKDWTLNEDALLKGGVITKDECPYLKPSSFITHMKGLPPELQACNMHFNVESGFERNGEFGSLLKEEWSRLIEFYPKLAVCEQKRVCDEDVHKLYDLSCFIEDNLWDYQLKCMIVCGLYPGFRGNKEHCDLKVSNMRTGKFEKGHPCDFCEGHIGVKKMSNKTMNISLKMGMFG